MIETYLSHLQFAIALISIISFIELSINFRKPITLKILILTFLSSIFVYNLASLLNLSTPIKEYARIILPLTGIHIFEYLYNFKLNKKLFIFSGICLTLLTFNLFALKLTYTDKYNSIHLVGRINRIIIASLIFAIFSVTYLKMIRSLDEKNQYSAKIKKWVRITIFLITVALLNNFSMIFFTPNFIVIKYISTIVHLTSCYLVVYRPAFLNRTELTISLYRLFKKTIHDQANIDQFINEFYTKSYFLNNNISLEDLAFKLKLDSNKLNDLIFDTTQMKFIDLVNKNRVDYYVKIISNGDFKEYTIDTLAQLCGFGSRQSLYRNFKKFHGGSPSDLISMHE